MKILMKYYLYAALIFIPLFFSCSPQRKATSFDEYMRDHDHKYREAGITDAERLTLQLIDTANEYNSKGVEGLDYDWILLCSYARLYLIHLKYGDEMASKNDLIKIMDIYKRKGFSPNQIDNEIPKLIDFVKGIDVKHSVKWLYE